MREGAIMTVSKRFQNALEHSISVPPIFGDVPLFLHASPFFLPAYTFFFCPTSHFPENLLLLFRTLIFLIKARLATARVAALAGVNQRAL